jgi:hypothetical protein
MLTSSPIGLDAKTFKPIAESGKWAGGSFVEVNIHGW